jgi:serine/threonine protein kinase
MQHLQPNTTLQGGKYRIDRVLGQGGFGITYLAVHIATAPGGYQGILYEGFL